ncbi:helix-turn-helix domain-containing protein [Ammoniphilus sp. CFH 90114]|uniref:helix-turn-helix domain-containing protein n=1 Tax=Ammoniphilus sp. CFH 90114 TaxID=2493665 RepID=UPI00100E5C59|nr:helix-turn-helix transcriptional regulator [Ammoniphilus sp. CFH 90114]RXT09032.1 XRE family transcriptional regulator [Ammoniphilus sp. CFH 90114]
MEEHRLGNRIRAFRKLKGYTQQEFAEKMGVSVALLGSVERGMKEPSEMMMKRIGELLGIELSELLAAPKIDHKEGS